MSCSLLLTALDRLPELSPTNGAFTKFLGYHLAPYITGPAAIYILGIATG